ncbi:MAG: hypothetical protein K1X50_10095, partial [Candidatus Promineofilum sp.]|nr:hypothetical protein [Promineifilum sp.]
AEARAFKWELGTINTVDTYLLKIPTRLNFQQSYDQTPLVFVMPHSPGPNAVDVRVDNVSPTGCDIYPIEPEDWDGPHISMTVHYLIIEPGVQNLPDGTVFEAGTLSTTAVQHGAGNFPATPETWANLTFQTSFSTALICRSRALSRSPMVPSRSSWPMERSAWRTSSSSEARWPSRRSASSWYAASSSPRTAPRRRFWNRAPMARLQRFVRMLAVIRRTP